MCKGMEAGMSLEYSGKCVEVFNQEAKRVYWDQILQGLESHCKEFRLHPFEIDESLLLFKQDICFWEESKQNKTRQSQSSWIQLLPLVLQS